MLNRQPVKIANGRSDVISYISHIAFATDKAPMVVEGGLPLCLAGHIHQTPDIAVTEKCKAATIVLYAAGYSTIHDCLLPSIGASTAAAAPPILA